MMLYAKTDDLHFTGRLGDLFLIVFNFILNVGNFLIFLFTLTKCQTILNFIYFTEIFILKIKIFFQKDLKLKILNQNFIQKVFTFKISGNTSRFFL